MQGLTERQRQILEFITKRIGEQGYPPTIGEIGEEMGIKSPNGLNHHLKALERKGYLKREVLKSRALRPVTSPDLEVEGGGDDDERVAPIGASRSNVISAIVPPTTETIEVPVLGRVAAGQPILADEHVEA